MKKKIGFILIFLLIVSNIFFISHSYKANNLLQETNREVLSNSMDLLNCVLYTEINYIENGQFNNDIKNVITRELNMIAFDLQRIAINIKSKELRELSTLIFQIPDKPNNINYLKEFQVEISELIRIYSDSFFSMSEKEFLNLFIDSNSDVYKQLEKITQGE
ncbi:MAG: hypothetical protein E6X34_11890 [Clostridium sp.]|uniref:hypothetical protein n=1 Tax=Clostridium sp. TaxID=1506 RepID=UPI0029135EB6|nr:hypothetical protein [Clostridium sp.]MDU4939148.1 hypothetical protein [Clostridium sp.]